MGQPHTVRNVGYQVVKIWQGKKGRNDCQCEGFDQNPRHVRAPGEDTQGFLPFYIFVAYFGSVHIFRQPAAPLLIGN